MCGIFGFIKPTARMETEIDLNAIFKAGLMFTQSRGEDATGYYSIGTGVVKTVDKADDFVAAGKVVDISYERFVLGHCRKASARHSLQKGCGSACPPSKPLQLAYCPDNKTDTGGK